MGFFMPDPDSRSGYFGSADLSGLNDPELRGPMPFGIPLAAIRSAFGAPEVAPSLRDPDSYEIAGRLPCRGSYCQSGGTRGMGAMYDLDGKQVCWDCAVKEEGIEHLSGAEKAAHLAPYLIGGDGSDGSSGVDGSGGGSDGSSGVDGSGSGSDGSSGVDGSSGGSDDSSGFDGNAGFDDSAGSSGGSSFRRRGGRRRIR